jgi:hypothetical protein
MLDVLVETFVNTYVSSNLKPLNRPTTNEIFYNINITFYYLDLRTNNGNWISSCSEYYSSSFNFVDN